MEAPRPNRKKWIFSVAALAGAAALLLLALLLLAGGRGLSARFDDPEELLFSYDPAAFPALTLEPDGAALVRLSKDDLYYYARSAGLLEPLAEELAQRGCTDAGVRFGEGGATVYARCRTFRFLTLTYKARCAVAWQNGRLTLAPEKVWLGNALVLPEKRWPELFRRELGADPGPVGKSVLEAAVKGESLEIRLLGLGEELTGRLEADRGLLCAAGICGVAVTDDSGAAALLSSAPEGLISMDGAEALLQSSGDVPAALAALLSGCTAESPDTLWQGLPEPYRSSLLDRVKKDTEERRSALESSLAAEQAKYEKLLTAVREAYKGGALAIGDTGFFSVSTGESVTAGALTALSASDTDSRIVLLYTARNSREICLSDMPALKAVPRAAEKPNEKRLSAAAACDLGVVLTSEGNVPLLLHRNRDGSFILRVLSDADYVSVLVEREIPLLCADDLPPAAASWRRPSGEGWNGALILLLK